MDQNTQQRAHTNNNTTQHNSDLANKIQNLYHNYEKTNHDNPFVSPVLKLSLHISRMLENQELTPEDLNTIIKHFTLDSLERRARHMAKYYAQCNEDKNLQTLNKLFTDLTKGEDKKITSFDNFQKRIEHLFYGFVFTAHPTFSMSLGLSRALINYAASLAGAKDKKTFEDIRKAYEEKPYSPLDLKTETNFSLLAIDNLHDAFEQMIRIAFNVAKKAYPDQWLQLRPNLSSIATWVGFDIDGRKDIQWAKTFENRIELQVRQLNSYQKNIVQLIDIYGENKTAFLIPLLKDIKNTHDLMKDHGYFFSKYNQFVDPNLQQLQEASKALIQSADKRLLSAKPLIKVIEKALPEVTDKKLTTDLLILLTQLKTFGLSRANVHFRINANQIHNAINNHLHLETHPDNASHRHAYISGINGLLKDVKPVNIHFGDIADEEMTARYEFMLIQQIVQYIDNDCIIRFLIAETESAFTLLTALYYAKLFKVEQHVDICPLFETERALQNGSRYYQTLLKNNHFKTYIRHRKRLSVQTGYSDAGRYIGQPAAGAYIERLKERIINLFDDTKLGDDVSLLFFDTHGESVGRGGHPLSYTERLRYICSPYLLCTLAQKNINYTQESSYQGGDGFLPFFNKSTTLALLTRSIEYFSSSHTNKCCTEDPYYTSPARKEVAEFFSASTNIQVDLVKNPHYANLLATIGTNMMSPSGSRAVKRSKNAKVKRAEISHFRAIPHNAILGQYGLLANTITGLGRAFHEHANFANELEQKSERLKSIFSLSDYAFSLSNPQIMKAYISLFNPTFWLTLAQNHPDLARSNQLSIIASHLEKSGHHDGIMSIYRHFAWDYTMLKRHRSISNTEDAEKIVNMACLHALRIALIRKIYILAMDIPRFNPQHSTTRRDLNDIIFKLDIDHAADLLEVIFPAHDDEARTYDFGEISEYQQQKEEKGEVGYSTIRNNITIPLQNTHKQIHDISTALAHYMGFFG
ncbi:MAG: phosphoenolpyruvate carboxylase [Alphaproteobacteria bacterium]|nr:phosphoenolpyruvate carboxylase [Alphaproteobacteria bacterium]